MGRSLLRIARVLLAIGVGAAAGPRAGADDATEPAVETLLASPLAAERDDGVRRLTAAGSAGREAARTLCESALLPLRLGGWRALAELGESEDLEAALAALETREGQEARIAAETALALAARLPVPLEAPLPEGRLSPRAVSALLGPVEDLLWRSSPDVVAPGLLRLGSGIAPVLATLAARSQADRGLRAEAVEALGAIGGTRARDALVRLLTLDAPPEPSAVYRALRHVARGAGLETVQRLALQSLVTASGPWRRAVVKQEAALFLQACPPSAPDPALRARLALDLRLADAGPRGGAAVELLRTWLALGTPSDAELAPAVRVLDPPTPERGWMLLAFEPWKERPPVRAALERLVARPGLPPSVAGWATLLLAGPGESPVPGLARAAVEGSEEGEGPDGRRLGLLLLGRLEGEPPADLVALGLDETDPWCRVFALNLVSRLPPTHGLCRVAAALAADRDDWVAAAAAEVPGVPWDLALRRRLGAILLGGPRDLRIRVVNLLQRRGEAEGAEGPADAVAAGSLDLRLRLAARLEAGAPR